MMSNALVDFYRGWMIEVNCLEDGFHCLCSSPVGEQLSDFTLHAHEADAQQAAMKLVDRAYACQGLKQWLRELYEFDQLPFEDWRALNQSLQNGPPQLYK